MAERAGVIRYHVGMDMVYLCEWSEAMDASSLGAPPFIPY
jgi:hypothetical protein